MYFRIDGLDRPVQTDPFLKLFYLPTTRLVLKETIFGYCQKPEVTWKDFKAQGDSIEQAFANFIRSIEDTFKDAIREEGLPPLGLREFTYTLPPLKLAMHEQDARYAAFACTNTLNDSYVLAISEVQDQLVPIWDGGRILRHCRQTSRSVQMETDDKLNKRCMQLLRDLKVKTVYVPALVRPPIERLLSEHHVIQYTGFADEKTRTLFKENNIELVYV